MDSGELRERLARIEENLKDHMRRSALLEERQDVDRALVLKTVSAMEKIEARNSVIFAVGAGILPLAVLLLQLWKTFH
jgi:hypothetical protein